MRQFTTPMMQQYAAIKKIHSDCLLFFRLGDFYELFLDDAKIGAEVLNITLTRRPRGKDGTIPMAGVPYHAASTYIAKLVREGYKVAICEQISEPDNRGIVDRDVIRIVTPGSLLDEGALDKKKSNYTLTLSIGKKTVGIAALEVSTGDFQATEVPLTSPIEEITAEALTRFSPVECILSPASYEDIRVLTALKTTNTLNIYPCAQWEQYAKQAVSILKEHFGVSTLAGFSIDTKPYATEAASVLLSYVKDTQKSTLSHVSTIRTYSLQEAVVLDDATIRNLELFETIQHGEKRGSFIHSIDHTKTAMGGRLLRSWIMHPLKTKKDINKRLSAVEALKQNRILRDKLTEILKEIPDIERLLSRLSVGVGTPPDIVSIKEALIKVSGVIDVLDVFPDALLAEIKEALTPERAQIAEYIGRRITDDPPIDPSSGGVIRQGVDERLDQLTSSMAKDKEWIIAFEAQERTETGIGSLKVRFNTVFGYYIEISKANLSHVPTHYVRKQTMVNAERFITDELKKYEDRVLTAEEKIASLETKLFQETAAFIVKRSSTLQHIAHHLAILDCLLSAAHKAEIGRYVKPSITTSEKLEITAGRHPVIEDMGEPGMFVSNNVYLDKKPSVRILTGPNMAGKSVYMRQTALMILMAHCGMFVPATQATISLVDRIFVRSGAADNIAQGLSTFMVEMVETAFILTHATNKSFIVMDEVGRGTSTYDGISIAWAVVEYISKHIGAKTLFATHYHELQELAQDHEGSIVNNHMAVASTEGNPVFLYQIQEGGAANSYGIAVAQKAGVPNIVTQTAQKKLSSFEQSPSKQTSGNAHSKLHAELNDISIDTLTPVEALTILARLKRDYPI